MSPFISLTNLALLIMSNLFSLTLSFSDVVPTITVLNIRYRELIWQQRGDRGRRERGERRGEEREGGEEREDRGEMRGKKRGS